MGSYHLSAEYQMYLQDTMVHYYDIKFVNFGFSAFDHSEIMKTETM